MNLIPMIAKELGVEIGEEFTLSNESHDEGEYYYFNGHELCHHIPGKTPDYAQYRTLADLVMGDKKIIKLPFEPKDGEQYWIVVWTNDNIFTTEFAWKEISCICCGHKYCGNVFRSEAEAEKHKFEIYEKLTGRKWGEK